ncbi:MAG: ATP-binding protein [Rubrivivax sp.]
MTLLHRLSFRQLLLLAFLTVAGVLGAVSLRGLYVFERLIAQSRAAADEAVALNAAAQQLAERGVAMERAARQYLVLDDPLLRRRFDDARAEARSLLDERLARQLPAALVEDWRERLDAIVAALADPVAARRLGQSALAPRFQALDAATVAIAAGVSAQAEARNARMRDEFEAGRRQLRQQVLAAIAFAALAALAFGVWLARPLRRLQRAVVGLGENRLDRALPIDGPSDLRALGRQLEWLRLRLQELDEDKARFLRHVSHELKTPLAALREGVALLQDEVAGNLSEDQREVVRILAQNTRTLQGQIEALLRFNAAAFEARRLTRRRLDLLALLQRAVEAQRLQWQAQRLQVRVQGEPLEIEADGDKLDVVIGNLLSNAFRYSPPDGSVTLRLARAPGWAIIDVIDQGPGLAGTDRERIFEPFYRGENQPAGAERGSGIGLSLVREYVQAHGGRVQAMNEPHGAHFRIELPHAPD